MSISLPEEDVAYIDTFARTQGFASRSAVLQQAVRLLRAAELSEAYEEAWEDWRTSPDAELWDNTAGDGLKA